MQSISCKEVIPIVLILMTNDRSNRPSRDFCVCGGNKELFYVQLICLRVIFASAASYLPSFCFVLRGHAANICRSLYDNFIWWKRGQIITLRIRELLFVLTGLQAAERDGISLPLHNQVRSKPKCAWHSCLYTTEQTKQNNNTRDRGKKSPLCGVGRHRRLVKKDTWSGFTMLPEKAWHRWRNSTDREGGQTGRCLGEAGWEQPGGREGERKRLRGRTNREAIPPSSECEAESFPLARTSQLTAAGPRCARLHSASDRPELRSLREMRGC